MQSSSVSNTSGDIVRLTRSALKLVKRKSEIVRHIGILRTNISLLEKAITNNIHVGSNEENPRRLEANLALLKHYLAILQQRKLSIAKKRGCGIGSAPPPPTNTRSLVWRSLKSCFDGRLLTGIIVNFVYIDPLIFLQKAYDCFSRKVNSVLKRSMVKVNVVLACNFIDPHNHDTDVKTFSTRNYVITAGTDLKQWYADNVLDKLQTKLEEFQEEGSGWALSEVLYLKVNINRYVPIRGGFFSTYIKVPHFIALKRAVVNVRNRDRYCFLWAVVSALFPVKKHADRVNNYPHFDEVLNRDSIKFPMKLSDIKKFERLNDLAINLYCVVKRRVLPFALSENVNARTINLLVLSSTLPSANNSSEKFYHFAWIKDLSALLSSQLSKRGHKKFFCNVCLNHFSSDALLRKHATHCHKINKCSVRLPDDAGKYLEFSHHLYKEKVPFAIYADLESILAKCDDTFDNANATLYQQRHLPFSIALYLKCSYDDSQSKFLAYRGADCITWFVNQLRDIAFRCNSIFDDIVPMETLSPAQIQSFDSATHCHICEKPFLENEIKVRDHSHLGKGEYRGPAHRGCNLNFQDSHAIPVVFHNLSGYDSHFLIRELATGIPGDINSCL
ncbi:hypothetical protein RI129_011510 [Pyrocoelia pectoralis]|uniref:C2H2-type domain-containing protein n=1 Tax=Pyrocoelia pectoralis TaxID=417401 RepID=A0AAN7V4G1_9COLE